MKTMTYKELKQSRFNTKVLSKYEENMLSALTKFLKFHGLSEDTSIGPEFAQDYEKSREFYLETYPNPTTRSSKKGNLHSWYDFFHKAKFVKDSKVEGHTFHSFVTQKIAEKNLTLRSLCRRLGTSTPQQWVNQGTAPAKRSLAVIDGMSELLGLPSTFLRENFFELPANTNDLVSIPKTSFQNKLESLPKGTPILLNKDQYSCAAIKTLKDELDHFYNYKTDETPGEIDEDIDRPESERWGKDIVTGYSGSINVFEGHVKSYFGFLVNFEKLEVKDLRLTQLIDLQLLNKYIRFQAERHGRKTRTTHALLVNIRVLIKYYLQYPHRAFPLIEKEVAVRKLIEINEKITKQIKGINVKTKSRKPEEQIKGILNLDEPLEPFIKMSKHLKDLYFYYQKTKLLTGTTWHEICRNIVLADLMIEKPIRCRNVALCTLEKNIYKKPNGRYELYFRPEETKNKKEIVKELSEELSAWIDLYLINHRNKIFKTTGDRLFVSSQTGKYNSSAISKVFARLCETHIGIELRMHSMRHIRATAYLLKNPKDYVYVADLLNDNLTTVIRAYSHLENRSKHQTDDKDLIELRRRFSPDYGSLKLLGLKSMQGLDRESFASRKE